MKKAILADSHPARQFLLSALVMICLWIIFQLAAVFSGMAIFGLNINQVAGALEALGDPAVVSFLKYVQLLSSVGMFIVSALAAAWFIDVDPLGYLGLRNRPGWRYTLAGVALFLLIIPFNNFLTYFNENLHFPSFLGWLESYFREKEDQMDGIMKAFLKPGFFGGLWFNLIVVAVIPAIGEELIFRGLVQKLFHKWFGRIFPAILVTSLLFAAMHFQFLSFLPRFSLGLILGFIFYRSGSIWLVMLLHLLNNATAVVYYYYNGFEGQSYIEDAGTPGNGLYLAVISALLCGGLLYLIGSEKPDGKKLS